MKCLQIFAPDEALSTSMSTTLATTNRRGNSLSWRSQISSRYACGFEAGTCSPDILSCEEASVVRPRGWRVRGPCRWAPPSTACRASWRFRRCGWLLVRRCPDVPRSCAVRFATRGWTRSWAAWCADQSALNSAKMSIAVWMWSSVDKNKNIY